MNTTRLEARLQALEAKKSSPDLPKFICINTVEAVQTDEGMRPGKVDKGIGYYVVDGGKFFADDFKDRQSYIDAVNAEIERVHGKGIASVE